MISYLHLYHPRTCANIRDRDHPDLCRAQSGHQLPVRSATNGPKMISEARPALFEIAEWSLDRHSNIRNPMVIQII